MDLEETEAFNASTEWLISMELEETETFNAYRYESLSWGIKGFCLL
jgi:hypothetical protein